MLPKTKKELKNNNTKDAIFVKKYFRRISKKKAIEINPYLKEWFKVKNNRNTKAYVCTKYNPKTKLCTIHGNSPDICKGYPLYPHIKYDVLKYGLGYDYKFYSDKCGFHLWHEELIKKWRIIEIIKFLKDRQTPIPKLSINEKNI